MLCLDLQFCRLVEFLIYFFWTNLIEPSQNFTVTVVWIGNVLLALLNVSYMSSYEAKTAFWTSFFHGSKFLLKFCLRLTRSSADADKPTWHHVMLYLIGSDDARPSYCVFSIFKKEAVRHFGFFLYFHNFCEKFKFVSISLSSYKIWWRSDDAWPSYCVFSIFKMAAVRHFGSSYYCNFFVKIQFFAYIFLVMQNLVKIGLSMAQLLHIFSFQNGGCPPSWIWYDIIADHPWLVWWP